MWRVLVWRVLVWWVLEWRELVWRVLVGRVLVGWMLVSHEGWRWVGHGRVMPEVGRNHVCRGDVGHVGWGRHVGHFRRQEW